MTSIKTRARRIALGNHKGGVFKTGHAREMAHGLARRGFAVLVIDMDPQGNLSRRLKAYDPNRPTMADVLTPGSRYTLLDAVVPCGWDVPEAAYIHVAQATADLEERVGEAAQLGSTLRLRAALDDPSVLEQGYDYIIIDTAPTTGHLLHLVLAALSAESDEIYVCVTPEFDPVEGAQRLHQIVTMWGAALLVPHLTITGILVSNWRDTDLHRQFLKELPNAIDGIPVCGPPIPQRIKLAEAMTEAEPITSYKELVNSGIVALFDEHIDRLTKN